MVYREPRTCPLLATVEVQQPQVSRESLGDRRMWRFKARNTMGEGHVSSSILIGVPPDLQAFEPTELTQEDRQKDSEGPRLGEAEGAGASDWRGDLLPDVPLSDPVLQEGAPWVSPEKCSNRARVHPLLNTADPGIGNPEPPASQQVPGTQQPSPLGRLSFPFWTFSIHHQQETQLCHG